MAAIRHFLHQETASGFLLIAAAILAMILANSPLADVYFRLIELPVGIGAGELKLQKPLLLWINDGLMAVFFLVVGLELKREMLTGELSSLRSIVLPAAGALGGMVAPALIYTAFNAGDAQAMSGWAVPVATDIAFALAVLLLLGKRVPTSLKLFLVSLAIFDDIGAIVIIALFYTSELSTTAMLVSGICLAMLGLINRMGVTHHAPYLLIGLIMWVAVLKSGVHATLAGVLLAMAIPHADAKRPGFSPLRQLEQGLHSTVALLILPLFAFANAGVRFAGLGWDAITHPVPLGIAAGLFLGKQLGVFSFCWLAVRLGLASMPSQARWVHVYGVAILCGIGFTMSLFIGSLSFEESGVNLIFDERLGIILGSIASAVAGYALLAKTLNRNTP